MRSSYLIICFMLILSCSSGKDILYIQDIDDYEFQNYAFADYKISTDDILKIDIETIKSDIELRIAQNYENKAIETKRFLESEREAIVKSEEIKRSYFNNQGYVLPLAVISTVGYMAVTKRCMKIVTFLANFR